MNWGKTIVYIDNSNIYRGGKDTGWLPEYEKLMRFLEELGGGLWDVHFFAIEETSNERTSTSDFFDYLQKGLGFTLHLYTYGFKSIRCVHCGRFSQMTVEKGLDVGVATQIMKDMHNRSFDTMILMSSNKDYIEVMDCVRQSGKKVKILIWRNTLSQELTDFSNRWGIEIIFLDNYREQLEKSYKPTIVADSRDKPIQKPLFGDSNTFSRDRDDLETTAKLDYSVPKRSKFDERQIEPERTPIENTFSRESRSSDEGTPLN